MDDTLAEDMWAQLDPDNDEIDRIILKEIMNYKEQRDDNDDGA